jgi:NAD(P)-dependent dehydrogenase (short-subunit alcohol dehydrogenase family)
MAEQKTKQRPPQQQKHQPGRREKMVPRPKDTAENYKAAGRLEGKVAIITGGDSGIGRSVAICFAKEGADIAIVYLDEHEDAKNTKRLIEREGVRCTLYAGDIADARFCKKVVDQTVSEFARLDILVNNAAEQHEQDSLEDIPPEQLLRTFETNVFAMFYLTQAALAHMKERSAIVNTASVTAFHGNPVLIDYASTKGAIVAFTRSLAKSLVKEKIRVNAVAPGPVWTPLIPASFDAKKVAEFGSDNPMGRAAEPDEVSPSFVFLASDDAAFVTGQVIHANGGSYFG